MAEPSTHASSPGDGWHVVDKVLDELERLSNEDLSDREFYEGLFQRLVPLGCAAAVVWNVDQGGTPRLHWRAPGLEAENGELTSQARQAAVAEAVQRGAPKLLGPAAPGDKTNGALSGRSIVAPWIANGAAKGALQVWLAPSVRPEATDGYLRLMAAVGELVKSFHAHQQQRRMQRQLDQQVRIDAFTQGLHESLDLNDTAYRLVGDARVLVGCDRVSVAVRRGNGYKVVAVSGAEHIHRRSDSARQLERLCAAVEATHQPLWHPDVGQITDLSHVGRIANPSHDLADVGRIANPSHTQPEVGRIANPSHELAPQISRPLADYLDLSPALALAVIPLEAPTGEKQADVQAEALLVFEQYATPFDPAQRDVIQAILGHARLALTNALLVRTIPGHRLWMAIGREGWLARWGVRSAIGFAVLAAILITLFAIPADVRVKARGELQPAVRHEVFAPRDGVVTAVFVDHGQAVQADEKLLEMRSPELDLELQRAAGELETTRKRLAATQSERLQIRPGEADSRLRERRLTAEEEQLQQQVKALEERQAMIQEQMKALAVRSPIAGNVTTWDAKKKLRARPLRRGDALVAVADVEGPWQLELKVPSQRAGRLLAARRGKDADQPVSFVVATDPARELEGTVKRVAQRVEIDESGESFLLVTVEFSELQIPHPVPGASAIARITCGQGSLAEAWFHDLWDALRLSLPF